jgi:hypothetical protein
MLGIIPDRGPIPSQATVARPFMAVLNVRAGVLGGAPASVPNCYTCATECGRIRHRARVVFLRRLSKSFAVNTLDVADQRIPTNPALIPRKVESLLLRQPVSTFVSVPRIVAETSTLRPNCGDVGTLRQFLRGSQTWNHGNAAQILSI